MCYCNNNSLWIFDKALLIVLSFEGGFVNHPNDPGGKTNKGIIQKVYDQYRIAQKLETQTVENISDIEVKEIYYNNYWLIADCHLLPMNLSIVHFDSAVNCGVRQANKFLQRSVNVIADGFIGPLTLSSMNNIKDKDGLNDILNKYFQYRLSFYDQIILKNSKLKIFRKGWYNRVQQLQQIINGGSYV
jgi:lysozyme family protein